MISLLPSKGMPFAQHHGSSINSLCSINSGKGIRIAGLVFVQ